MVKLLRRSKNGNGSAPEAPAASSNEMAIESTTEHPTAEVAAAPPPEAATAEAQAPAPQAAQPSIADERDSYHLPTGGEPAPTLGAIGTSPPIPYEPAPPPPPPPRTSGGLFSKSVLDPGEATPEERDRIAAMEFEQAIAPVMDLMRAAVPGANTIEDTSRILYENEPDPPKDPNPGAYVPGDAFEEDARVYYRLLRRDYEKNPRPSQKRALSHHLHGVYGKLTGTKGW